MSVPAMKLFGPEIQLSLAVAVILAGGASGWSVGVQQSHITANVPEEQVFETLLQRGLARFGATELGTEVVPAYELLRRAPTQTGISYPKYYAWVEFRTVEGALVAAGAARLVAIDGREFEVTHFLRDEAILELPGAVATVFPAALTAEIVRRALGRREGPQTFEAHPAEILAISEPALDLDSHPIALKYRTRISRYVAEAGVNFAGRFTIATWGCGTSCLEFAIVDPVSGRIWKPDCVALRGLDFRPDSRLLIVDSDPPVSYAPGPRSYYLWSEESLKPLSAPDERGITTRCSGRLPSDRAAELEER